MVLNVLVMCGLRSTRSHRRRVSQDGTGRPALKGLAPSGHIRHGNSSLYRHLHRYLAWDLCESIIRRNVTVGDVLESVLLVTVYA